MALIQLHLLALVEATLLKNYFLVLLAKLKLSLCLIN
jgi:hypothetical protein